MVIMMAATVALIRNEQALEALSKLPVRQTEAGVVYIILST